ncbi:MAG: DNA translocase FtsK [Actinobacteria bacterium]|nr:DNA translocase FtsK [Actinomycetota bacterium]
MRKKISGKNSRGLAKKQGKEKNRLNRSNSQVRRRYARNRAELFIILAIMFSFLCFIALFGPKDSGIIIRSLEYYLSYTFGLGKYLFPFLLLGWGISFFIRKGSFTPLRTGWGFFLLFVSVLGLLGSTGLEDFFDPIMASTKGGVVGWGASQGLFKLFGRAGSIAILSFILLASLIIIAKISVINLLKKIGWLFLKALRLIFKLLKRASEKIRATRTKPKLHIEMEKKEASFKYGTEREGVKSESGELARMPGREELKKSEPLQPWAGYPGLAGSEIIYEKTERVLKEQHKEAKETEGTYKETREQLEIPLATTEEEDTEYRFPPISLLRRSRNLSPKLYKQNIRENVDILNRMFSDFNLSAKITRVVRGPTVTLYELSLSPGVKVQRLLSLEDDFCVAMGSPDLRILAPIPGKSAIGIEVPNKIKSIVTLGDIYSTEDRNLSENLLCVPLGKNLSGEIVYMDIRNMPHVLIAGATNSGKSSCLNSIITSLLMKVKPGEVKFIMIDPKMVELSVYNGIPHLLTPVVINPKKAAAVLNWVVDEMESRFEKLVSYSCKSIEVYNLEVQRHRGVENEDGRGVKPLPYILVFIDELADLMMVSASEVEDSICRIAQMGRAVGIHLIVATQRPSVNIITGLIKANIPSRISFMVASNTDSRVILDCGGAEKLIGRGDMLYLPATSTRPERLQGAYVTSKEIEMITSFIKSQKKPQYSVEIPERYEEKERKADEEDDFLYEALKIVVEYGHASTSLLQRKLRIGYSRAARIIDQLEEKGFISGYDGSKPREVLISREELGRILKG